MSSDELQALFSNLRPRSQERTSTSPANSSLPQHSSRPSTSAFFQTAAMPSTPPPPFSVLLDEHDSSTNGPLQQNRSTSGATAQNLLNLLNFGVSRNATISPSLTTPDTAKQIEAPQSASAPLSATDLVAKFMSPTIPTTGTSKLSQKEDAVNPNQARENPSRNPLLELLNKQANEALGQAGKDSGHYATGNYNADQPMQSIEISDDGASSAGPRQRHESPVRVFGTAASREHTPFEAPQGKSKSGLPQLNKPIFTYTNPFEALNASRTDSPAVGPHVPELVSTPASHPVPASDTLASPSLISARKKLTPRLRSQRSASSAVRDSSPNLPTNETKKDVSETGRRSEVGQMQPSMESPGATASHEIDQMTADNTNVQTQTLAATDDTQHIQDDSGDWEDADASIEQELIPRKVPVYNFPIKAFVSIALNLGAGSDVGIREDGVMEISRLKKDFDQLDRSLAVATSKYITYAFVKNGGMRIIRQDDGSDRHVFKNSGDRIFNVAFCTTALNTAASDNQAILGTGVSGAVYYASVSKEGNDLFEKNQLELESLIFPPYPQADENTAGGVLKTRAKRSSRHPEYFAIGRGKSIQLIWPATALSPRYGITEMSRTVDVERFYADRPLQISTGKAGKDFTFSEDDTLIVSLDKTGRLRFWDIQGLVDETNATAARVTPVVVDMPILSLSTASPAEKSWPTSVTFVDKARPYRKGGALRYVLVGLRQNHTLQLWDIALGKAVQELNFPHENETDGICSVNYHPECGIIVVSHPTRNSIFFIHLSAPRYTLSSQLSQATYVQRVAAKDPELPKPESTACMSGIRELSFAEKGQLRSVELLPIQKSSEAKKDESSPLFELYVVHSKGVTCLQINREDLGWNSDNKVVHPIDAQQEGLVTLKELRLGSVIEEPIRNGSPTKEVQVPSKASKKKAKKAAQAVEEPLQNLENTQQVASASPTTVPAPPEVPQPDAHAQEGSTSKESKKAKKKAEKAAQAAQAAEKLLGKADNETQGPLGKSLPAQQIGQAELPIRTELPSNQIASTSERMIESWLEKELPKIERTISGRFKQEFDALYQNIQSDRAAQNATSASRQETIIRLVSDSLSINVEKSLSQIITQQIQKTVVPAIIQHTSSQIADALASVMPQVVSQALSAQLPNVISVALQSSQTTQTIAELVAQKVSKQMEGQFVEMMTQTIVPAMKDITVAAVKNSSTHREARLLSQVQQLQQDRVGDSEKLERLSNLVQGIAGTLQALSDSQLAFQAQILKDRQALTSTGASTVVNTSRQVSTARGTPDPTPLTKPKPTRIRTKAEIELEDITTLMNAGRYEEGSIKWLQSAQPVKVFDELFVRFTPEYLATDVSPLVAFSVAVTVASSLDTNTDRRLEWISAAFDAVDLQDPEIADLSQHAPALITSLVQKLESLYMTLAERNPSDSMLRTIPILAKKARDIKAAFIARAAGSIGSAVPHLAGSQF